MLRALPPIRNTGQTDAWRVTLTRAEADAIHGDLLRAVVPAAPPRAHASHLRSGSHGVVTRSNVCPQCLRWIDAERASQRHYARDKTSNQHDAVRGQEYQDLTC